MRAAEGKEYLNDEGEDGERENEGGCARGAVVLIVAGGPGDSPVDEPDEVDQPRRHVEIE